MRVSVAYANNRSQHWLPVIVPKTCSVAQAIKASKILERYPDIDLGHQKVGVFGKLAKLDSLLNDGDRVEIYRPIIADPQTVPRRQQAEPQAEPQAERSSA